jgi:hypothetical protein
MKTIDQPMSQETLAVVESLATGKPLDPAIARKIHEKARQIKERVFQEQGLLDLGVPAIREFRGELPE